jgi:hypothetical protein
LFYNSKETIDLCCHQIKQIKSNAKANYYQHDIWIKNIYNKLKRFGIQTKLFKKMHGDYKKGKYWLLSLFASKLSKFAFS